MKEVILCKYGEIVLKGLNRGSFESMLLADLRRHIASRECGDFEIFASQSTAYIEPKNDDCDLDEALDEARHVFGFNIIERAAVADKDMDEIGRVVCEYFADELSCAKSFRAEAKRSDKTFPIKSPEIGALIGAAVLERFPHLKVSMSAPEVTIKCEIRERGAYLSSRAIKGAGGVPAASSGRAMLLLSGGIDSPVAAYMMAKRGTEVEAVYFESPPYTSLRAREKVLSLAEKIAAYTGHVRVNVISLTHAQEEIVRHCDEEYFTLLLRRFMMRVATKLAHSRSSHALITGESLGQVASQTLLALCYTDRMSDLPIFRPCIGMDKEDIITIARQIGTFDLSILPYEDCCTVFTPKHPKTKPDPEKVEAQAAKIDCEALEEEALASLTVFHVGNIRK